MTRSEATPLRQRRPRRSTLVLLTVFLVTFVTYLYVRPPVTGAPPAGAEEPAAPVATPTEQATPSPEPEPSPEPVPVPVPAPVVPTPEPETPEPTSGGSPTAPAGTEATGNPGTSPGSSPGG